MNTRRSFFKKLYAAAAIVALAPQLAFGRRLFDGTNSVISVADYEEWCELRPEFIDWKKVPFWSESYALAKEEVERGYPGYSLP